MLSPKSLISNALLKPLAKNPPNGATSEANAAMINEWIWNGAYGIEGISRPMIDWAAD
jgi:hypothetical protein